MRATCGRREATTGTTCTTRTSRGLSGWSASGYFHLSSGDRMNDRQELLKGSQEVWKNTLSGASPTGRTRTWRCGGCTGCPGEDAVCIVPGRQMNEWVDGIEEVYLIGDGATYEPAERRRSKPCSPTSPSRRAAGQGIAVEAATTRRSGSRKGRRRSGALTNRRG